MPLQVQYHTKSTLSTDEQNLRHALFLLRNRSFTMTAQLCFPQIFHNIYCLSYIAPNKNDQNYSFLLLSFQGPIENKRTLNLIQWTVQLFALIMIFLSSYHQVSTLKARPFQLNRSFFCVLLNFFDYYETVTANISLQYSLTALLAQGQSFNVFYT